MLGLITAALSSVTPLHPANWHEQLAGRTWMVMFGVTGCKHCNQMRPMWEEMANQLAASEDDVHVGRVNSTSHNGLTTTMRVCSIADEPALTSEETGPQHTHAPAM